MKNEIWKPVPGYKGYYEVSNEGQVRSLDRTIWYRRVERYSFLKGKPMVPQKDYKGYLKVRLSKRGITKNYAVHRLIVHAFIKKIPKNKEINHLNGVKSDNRLSNLAVVSASENVKHAYKLGLKKAPNQKGERNRMSKLKRRQALAIFNAKGKHKDIASRYGIARVTVTDIKNKRIWKHIHKAES